MLLLYVRRVDGLPLSRKMAEWGMEGMNQGDDFGGIVHSVGANITEFHPGDRVAGFHAMMKPGGAYAEYTISPAHMTFHIPKKTTFEEAATIPLTAMTAAVLLDHVLGLPQRGSDLTKPTPLVIYGAASAVGAYAVQLANKAGIHPLICVAGKGIPFVESLIDKSKGDVVIDYRKDGLVDGIKSAVPSGEKLMYAFDAISGHGSYQNICKVLSTDGGKLALVLPPGDDIPKGIQATQGQVGIAFNDQKELGFAWSRLFGLGLQDGWLHPVRMHDLALVRC